MHRRAIVLGVAAAALTACSRQQDKAAEAETEAEAAPPEADPAAFVRALYEPYLTGGALPEFRRRPWSARLRSELDAMIARSNAINEPILDFDPIIDAQDYELRSLNVIPIFRVEAANAGVRAQFVNMGEPREVIYDLVWEGGGWRIDNMRTSVWNLRQIAAAPNADAIRQ